MKRFARDCGESRAAGLHDQGPDLVQPCRRWRSGLGGGSLLRKDDTRFRGYEREGGWIVREEEHRHRSSLSKQRALTPPEGGEAHPSRVAPTRRVGILDRDGADGRPEQAADEPASSLHRAHATGCGAPHSEERLPPPLHWPSLSAPKKPATWMTNARPAHAAKTGPLPQAPFASPTPVPSA